MKDEKFKKKKKKIVLQLFFFTVIHDLCSGQIDN